MDNIKLFDDEQSRIIVKEWIDKLNVEWSADLSPCCIGEKIMLWFNEVDRFQEQYNTLEDYAILVRDYISQVKENDEVLEEIVDEISSCDELKFSNRTYFRILKNAIRAVRSPADFLKQLGFVDQLKALEVLSMEESDEAVNLYAGLECTFDPSNKKQKYLFMLAYNHYQILGGEVVKQMRMKSSNMIHRYRVFKDVVSKYWGAYDYWKNINSFSFNDIIRKKTELHNMLLQGLDHLYANSPYVLVEFIFMEYYLIYDNYEFNFSCLPRLVKISKMKKYLKLSSVNFEYGNDIYEEYLRYCNKEGIEPVFQFGNQSYISEEMFNKASKEADTAYFDLGLTYKNIKGLYDELLKYEWIDQHTPFNLFVYYFSGKCRPTNLSPILWTTQVNELAYLFSKLYNELLSASVHFKLVKKIFVVQGKINSSKEENLSALANGLSKKRKSIVDNLYDAVFR